MKGEKKLIYVFFRSKVPQIAVVAESLGEAHRLIHAVMPWVEPELPFWYASVIFRTKEELSERYPEAILIEI